VDFPEPIVPKLKRSVAMVIRPYRAGVACWERGIDDAVTNPLTITPRPLRRSA
jgi:hypothetical protein